MTYTLQNIATYQMHINLQAFKRCATLYWQGKSWKRELLQVVILRDKDHFEFPTERKPQYTELGNHAFEPQWESNRRIKSTVIVAKELH